MTVTGPVGAPFRVLIVEDEFLIAMVAEDALLQAGFAVVGVASSFEQALALCETEAPDLALMDIRLATPRDGIDAAIEIRQRHGVASLFASANHDPAAVERASAARPAGWLSKPYTPESLVEAVRIASNRLPRGTA